MIELRGITWNHTRGYLPLVAAAQRFEEQHAGSVRIAWEKRSLQAFGDAPIDRLAEEFDLLVIDHPFVGSAASHPRLVPLDEHVPKAFLADQAANSVGGSFESYASGDHLWALPIDAAAPVAASRDDLLKQANIDVPETWEELLSLARQGLVALPAIAVDSFLHWIMLCAALGEMPLARADRFVRHDIGRRALAMLGELVWSCDLACLTRNPIATYEAMVSGNTIAYCPFAYLYANYARADYSPSSTLQFRPLVRLGETRLRSVLGGTGLAVSARCKALATAIEYARFAASPTFQRGLYFTSGGQPGHRSAWTNATVNQACSNALADTLGTMDEALIRPLVPGYMTVQDAGGPIVHRFLRREADESETLQAMDAVARQACGRR